MGEIIRRSDDEYFPYLLDAVLRDVELRRLARRAPDRVAARLMFSVLEAHGASVKGAINALAVMRKEARRAVCAYALHVATVHARMLAWHKPGAAMLRLFAEEARVRRARLGRVGAAFFGREMVRIVHADAAGDVFETCAELWAVFMAATPWGASRFCRYMSAIPLAQPECNVACEHCPLCINLVGAAVGRPVPFTTTECTCHSNCLFQSTAYFEPPYVWVYVNAISL